MSVAQASKNARSCETATTMRSFFGASAPHSRLKCSCSHRTPCKSRWFVGSSSRRMSGRLQSTRANASRMRHPPDSSCTFRRIKPSSKLSHDSA
mmetsp:Transcript_122460/g.305786  ORF Transcript_122460/g.305786 Transcript_122460/m.305786 type:complete len:94 (-) Transcript_122460:1384-1665(-)